MKKFEKVFLTVLLIALFAANFLVLFHAVAPKAEGDWEWIGTFTMDPNLPCYCSISGHSCLCWVGPPPIAP